MRQEVSKAVDIALQIVQQLTQPFFTLSERRLCTDEGKDIAVGKLIAIEIAEETLAQLLVGTIADRAAESGYVECLAGRDKSNRDIARIVADRTETDVAMRRKGEVGMYLVGDDIHIVAIADVGNATEGLFVPDGAAGVVGVAEDEPAALMRTLFEVVEVDGKTPVDHFERAADELAMAVFRQSQKGWVDGGGDEDSIARIGHCLQYEGDACHDAGNEV